MPYDKFSAANAAMLIDRQRMSVLEGEADIAPRCTDVRL